MAQLDRQIDELYQLSPSEFTASRTELAKTLTGEEARRVRGLKKPTAVPWSVNQVYWKARPVYTKLIERGKALRDANIAALKGRKADVRAATDAHRRAVSDAVGRAAQLASDAGLNPSTDQLARMFEAVSLAPSPSEETGRFTEIIGPSGFEALAGVSPLGRPPASLTAQARSAERVDDRDTEREEKERRQRRADAERVLKTAIEKLERARERAGHVRKALDDAEAAVASAERAVAGARAALDGIS